MSVAGTIESTSGGFKFPDGSVLTTAKSNAQRLKSAGYTAVPGSTWTKLEMSGLVFGTGSFVDHSSTSVLQAPITGVYDVHVVAIAHVAANGQSYGLDLYKNGASLASSNGPVNGLWQGAFGADLTMTASTLVQLNAGDQITAYGWQNTGGNVPIGSGALEMHYVGQ